MQVLLVTRGRYGSCSQPVPMCMQGTIMRCAGRPMMAIRRPCRCCSQAGANVHAEDDHALRRGANWGQTETVRGLAAHIFAPDSWRGKNRTEIESAANALYDKIKAENPQSERLRTAGTILLDCAL